ncbi:MAG: HD domain-containing protein [Clostridium sp.]|jgi:3'-5' exoribonuclease|nr:HD domain-containing protein [Clostridium sp.]
MDKLDIKKIEIGKIVAGELAVIDASIENGVKGPYAKLTLSDGNIEVNAKRWSYNGPIPKKGEVISIVATAGTYNKDLQLVLTSWDKGEMPVENFLKHGPNSPKDCYTKIIDILNEIYLESAKWEQELINFTKDILNSNKKLFATVPAAVSIHHNYYGGLAQHTLEVVLEAQFKADYFNKCTHSKNISIPLTICGAALHDIGKVRAYCMEGVSPSMTTEGKFMDHIVLGVTMLYEKANSINNSIAKEKWFLELCHIITSHHGELEYGSPVKPCFTEAYIVSQADMSSARLTSMSKALEEQSGEWGDKRDFIFGTRLYKRM